jgi:hypothetical protein
MDNEAKRDDITVDGDSTSPSDVPPRHLDVLPDIDNVEELIGDGRVYDEETAGALAALMFAKEHPDESVSKVAPAELPSEEIADVKAVKKGNSVAVVILLAVVLVEMLWGYLKTYPWEFAFPKRGDIIFETTPLPPEYSNNETHAEPVIKENITNVITDSIIFHNRNDSSTEGQLDSSFGITSEIPISNVKDDVFTSVDVFDSNAKEHENVRTDVNNFTIIAVYDISTFNTNYSEISSVPVQKEIVVNQVAGQIEIDEYGYFDSNLPQLGDSATMRLVCLCELFALGRIKKRESELLDECEDEDLYAV